MIINKNLSSRQRSQSQSMVTHLKQRHSERSDKRSRIKRTGSYWRDAPGIKQEGGIAQVSLSLPGMPRARRKLLFIAVIFLSSVAGGCTTQKDIEAARNRGARAGAQDGQSAGDAAGYNAAFKVAEDASYTGTLNQLYASGNFHRRRIYSFAALAGAFLLGFGVQYAVLYLLRRKELLYDIDHIILRKQVTEVDLTNLLERQTPEDAMRNLS